MKGELEEERAVGKKTMVECDRKRAGARECKRERERERSIFSCLRSKEISDNKVSVCRK